MVTAADCSPWYPFPCVAQYCILKWVATWLYSGFLGGQVYPRPLDVFGYCHNMSYLGPAYSTCT
jgi:hypothetical protein